MDARGRVGSRRRNTAWRAQKASNARACQGAMARRSVLLHRHAGHCLALYGLAKRRQAADGTVGCMDPLVMALDELSQVVGGPRPDVIEGLLLRESVPCAAEH